MKAETEAFIAEMRSREAHILRSIDAIDARITRVQGRIREMVVDASDVVGDQGDHAGATGLGDGAVREGEKIQPDVTPAEEVDAGGVDDRADGCSRRRRSSRLDVTEVKEDELEKLMLGEVTGGVVGDGDDGSVGDGGRGLERSIGSRRFMLLPYGCFRWMRSCRLDVTPATEGEKMMGTDVVVRGEEKMSIGERVGFTLHRIFCNYYGVIAALVIGAICAFTSPIFLTTDTDSWLRYGTFAAVSFFIVSLLGFQYQNHRFMRETPDLVTRLLFIVLSSVLTNIVGNFLRTSELYYYAFSLIGLAVFCLVELAQPTCDFGIVQFFVCLPLQIAIPLHGLTLHWSYIPASVMPLFCLTAQICFTAHYDRIYQNGMKGLETPLLGDIV